MKRLILILNGKGGVGKSFFAVNYVQFLKDKGIAHVAIDSDNESSTLKRFHPETLFFDLNNGRILNAAFIALAKTDLVDSGNEGKNTETQNAKLVRHPKHCASITV